MKEVLILILGIFIGEVSGITIMSCLQINRLNDMSRRLRDKEKKF